MDKAGAFLGALAIAPQTIQTPEAIAQIYLEHYPVLNH